MSKNQSRVLCSVIAILVMLLSPHIGYAIAPDDVVFGGMALAGLGELELKDLNDLLEKQGKAFNEFKSTNDQRLEAIEKKGYAPADLEEKVGKINDEMNALGKQIQEIAKKANRPAGGSGGDESPEHVEHKLGFRKFMLKGDDAGLKDLERKAFQRGSDVEGGYFIDVEMDSDIDRVAGTVSNVRNLVSVRTIGSAGYAKRVKTSGTSARWVGEGEEGGETAGPKYARIEINAEEMEIEPWVYNSALEDADQDIYSDLVEEAGIGFGEGEAVAFVNGNGVKKPRGFLTYNTVANASYAWGNVGYMPSGAAGDFAGTNPGDNIIDFMHSLKSAYRNGAVMLMNDTTLSKVRQIKDGSGNFYLFQPDPTGKFGGFVLGAPVEIDDNMPDIGANSLSIAYANWQRAYRIVDRKGVVLIRDNITTKGTTKYNFRKRTGGGILNFEAIKLMKFATS